MESPRSSSKSYLPRPLDHRFDKIWRRTYASPVFFPVHLGIVLSFIYFMCFQIQLCLSGSEMDRYIDEDEYGDQDRSHRQHFGRRFHHARHRRPFFKGGALQIRLATDFLPVVSKKIFLGRNLRRSRTWVAIPCPNANQYMNCALYSIQRNDVLQYI